MQLLTLTQSPAPAPSWCVDVRSPYNESVVAQLKSMPGLRWDSARKVWYGDREAALIVAETLEAARVTRTVNELGSEPSRIVVTPPPNPELRDYQNGGRDWLVRMLETSGAALLADQMGIGKSAQAAVAADVIGGHTIVVCPAVVRRHWEGQIRRWSNRGPDSSEGCKWHVYSYEGFRKAQKAGEVGSASTIVVDECHYISNPKALRSKAVAAYTHVHPETKRILLSGTPMTDKPSDLWHGLDVMHPGRFGTRWQFEKRYCGGEFTVIPHTDPPKSYWKADGVSRADELARRLKSVMLRRTIDEVHLELPARTRNVIEIELPKAIARDLVKAVSVLGPSGSILGVSQLLSDIEIHKCEAAENLVADIVRSGGRALVLTTRKETASRLGASLDAPAVTGDTPADERQAILADAVVGVATMYSVQEGIDLVGFDHVIFVGLDWIPKVLLQAAARVYRIGQTRHVTEHYLIGVGTLDEVVRERVIERLDTFDKIIGSEGSGLKAELGGLEEDILASIVSRVKGKRKAA